MLMKLINLHLHRLQVTWNNGNSLIVDLFSVLISLQSLILDAEGLILYSANEICRYENYGMNL